MEDGDGFSKRLCEPLPDYVNPFHIVPLEVVELVCMSCSRQELVSLLTVSKLMSV
jgi:hypothetical protein